MIGIIDYKAGNSNSVKNACEKLSIENMLISNADELFEADAVILPGVGSAGETMRSLSEMGLVGGLRDRVLHDKIPYLGICVGMQILFNYSEEGDAECLGWLKGKVIKFDKNLARIPQIGWNDIVWEKQSVLRRSSGDDPFFYFVNSYHAVPGRREDILVSSFYGAPFVSMVERGNIYGAQFHIEKSGTAGLQILKNFSLAGDKTYAD